MKPRRRGPDPEIVARVQRAQEGDEQAFSVLFEQLQAPVLNYAHQILSDRSSAEDASQDAFLVRMVEQPYAHGGDKKPTGAWPSDAHTLRKLEECQGFPGNAAERPRRQTTPPLIGLGIPGTLREGKASEGG